mmetsp:Transcript_86676/g.240357  ORF Transcript_86676/g.240357 Transcript_86676/m.240357 type:complete len:87 (-) Transcript_86676:1485-1745(-)
MRNSNLQAAEMPPNQQQFCLLPQVQRRSDSFTPASSSLGSTHSALPAVSWWVAWTFPVVQVDHDLKLREDWTVVRALHRLNRAVCH